MLRGLVICTITLAVLIISTENGVNVQRAQEEDEYPLVTCPTIEGLEEVAQTLKSETSFRAEHFWCSADPEVATVNTSTGTLKVTGVGMTLVCRVSLERAMSDFICPEIVGTGQ